MIDTSLRRTTVIVAKAAITGAATDEMATWAGRLAALTGEPVVHAFTEQGEPTLRQQVHRAVAEGCDELLVLPLLWPMEPGLRNWLSRVLQRWRHAATREEGAAPWPAIRIAPQPGEGSAVLPMLQAMRERATETEPLAQRDAPLEAVLVPKEMRRVLVCQGGPCNNAGAASVWGHLRNEQKRLNLRGHGDGMMSCKTSCLGPCSLGPVVQVFPEGTWYGGVDEAGMDRIIRSHLMAGRPVEDLAYAVRDEKQRLREARPGVEFTSSPPSD